MNTDTAPDGPQIAPSGAALFEINTDARQPCGCRVDEGHICEPPFYDGNDWPDPRKK